VIDPGTYAATRVMAWAISDIRTEPPSQVTTREKAARETDEAGSYVQLVDGRFVPMEVYRKVLSVDGFGPSTQRSDLLYQRYVELTYLPPYVTIPLLIALFLLAMYLIGTLLAGGVTRTVWNEAEQLVARVPVIRALYRGLREFADSVIIDRRHGFSKAIAIEYPCRGCYALAFVNGEGLSEISAAAGEPVLSILVPTVPIPVKGYTAVIPESAAIDLNISIEEAFQYLTSLGTVVPKSQRVTKTADGQ